MDIQTLSDKYHRANLMAQSLGYASAFCCHLGLNAGHIETVQRAYDGAQSAENEAMEGNNDGNNI